MSYGTLISVSDSTFFYNEALDQGCKIDLLVIIFHGVLFFFQNDFDGHNDVKMSKNLRVRSLVCIYRLINCCRYGFQEFSSTVILQKQLPC